MTTYLLITAVVIFACVFLSKVSSRLGIPMLLAFILLGMLFGSDGILKIPFDNYAFAEQICTVALIFIMFYGGFGTNWQQAKSVAVKAGLLSTAGVVITAALTGVFCHYALHIAWVESMLIGALIGSTDAASVFSVLRSKRLSLRYNTASLLEVESGSNDPCAYMLTVTFIAIAQGSASGGQIGLLIVKQMLFGILFGGLIAAAAVLLLKKIKFSTAGFDMVFVVGIAVIGYALPAVFGGNGFLSVYIVGIVLGNTEIRNKRNLVNFFDGLTGLMHKGLMPNPKAGTVTMDVTKAVQDIKAGKIEYRLDKANIVHVPVGKVSFSEEQLVENVETLMGAITKAKPAAAKGQYYRSVSLSATMGPGVKLNTAKYV